MNKIALCICCVIISHYNILAQNISGKVVDEENNRIINVHVTSSNGSSCFTDKDGNFNIEIKQGYHQISFEHINFTTRILNVSLTHNEDKEVYIVLQKHKNILKDVEVLREKNEKIISDILSIRTIESRKFEEEINNDLSDIVEMFSGVTLTGNQMSIRGGSGWNAMAGSRVLVLTNDIPLLSGDMGQIPWDLIPIENIDQIEVIKGASSAIYGSSAMNGVINVHTKSANKKLIDKHRSAGYSNIKISYSIYDSPKRESIKWWEGTRNFYNADILHANIIGSTSLTIGLNHFKDQGYRFLEENNRSQISFNILRNSNRIENLRYGINATIMKQDVGNFLLWESYDHAYIPIDSNLYQTNSLLYHVDPFISHKTNQGKHEIKGRYMKIILDNNTNGIETAKDLYSSTSYIDYKYKGWLPILSSNIVIGATNTNVLSRSEVFNGENKSNNTSIYTLIEKDIDKTTFSFGTRYEYIRIKSEQEFIYENSEKINDLKISFPLFYAGMKHDVNANNIIRTYFGQGVRFPSIAEISTSTNVHAGTYIYPNLDLKPENGWSYELAYHYTHQRSRMNIDMDIAYFLMRYENMMEFSFAQWGTEYDIEHAYGLGFRTVNIGKTQIDGVETEIDIDYKVNEKIRIKISIGHTYMNPISLTPDSVYAATEHFGIIEPITFNNSSSDTAILKYRYQHLLKIDAELRSKRFNIGTRIKYNDYMRNIDEIFTTDLVNYGIPEINHPPIIPGINESRNMNKWGDMIIDVSCGWKINSITSINFIINNLMNEEIYTRPTNTLPPRIYSIKLNLSI